jgi:hypothetical protein
MMNQRRIPQIDHQSRTRFGVSRTDILVILIVLVVLVVLATYGAAILHRAQCGAASLQDKIQLRQVHEAMLLYANDANGVYPTPGLIRPLRDGDGKQMHDFSQNFSAPLYSYLIAANLLEPATLVSSRRCLEVNRGVRVKRDYNFDAYDPARHSFWDDTFTMRIDDPSIGANASYAHFAICGERLRNRWRAAGDPTTPILSTRGTRDGVESGDECDRSPVLRIHGPKSVWVGNVVMADNHVETWNGFVSSSVTYPDADGRPQPDNIFAAEFDHPLGPKAAGDAYLGIFIEASEHDVTAVYDPLD